MRPILRQVHAAAAWLFVAAILAQVFLAGSAIANLGGSGDFTSHMEFGYSAVGLAALAVLLTAVAAGGPRRSIGISFGLLLLYVLQTALPSLKTVSPAIAALHPVNALLLFAVATWYARRAWRDRIVADAAERSASPAPPAERAASTPGAS
jgi:hypothetical protein